MKKQDVDKANEITELRKEIHRLYEENHELRKEIERLDDSIGALAQALFRLWNYELMALERSSQITGYSETILYQSPIKDIMKQAEKALEGSGRLKTVST